MRIHAFTISFPPRRFIGSELMTAKLLEALASAGHEVSVVVGDGAGEWNWHGIPVSGNALTTPPSAEVVIVHAGRSWPGVEYRQRRGGRLVMICHNTSEVVHDDVAGAAPDLIVVNSQTMADELGVDALVVNPPAPDIAELRPGDRVVTLSLNELKGGAQFFRLAERMPHIRFLAVRGGYGTQLEVDLPNVEILDHIPHDQLATAVWAHAGAFLQLSEQESWGMAASEARAHGIPVIAHPTPGLLENFADAALWVDRDAVDALAAAVQIALGDSTWRAASLSRAREIQRASRMQIADWVTTIERLGHGAQDQRDGAARRLQPVGG